MKMMLKCDNKFKEGERVGEGVREKEEDRRREAGTDGRRGGGGREGGTERLISPTCQGCKQQFDRKKNNQMVHVH